MRGFYLMHRGWLDHPAFGNRKREPFCRAAAWAWLIDEAAYEPRSVNIAGKVIELQRGQLTHSLRFLALAWGWQHDRCRRFLNDLSHSTMITTATATGGATGQLIITICNYEKYQDAGKIRATARATRHAVAVRQPCDSGATDLKEGKEGKEDSPLPPNGGVTDFDRFWDAYPRRVGKTAAQRKFAIAVRAVEPATLVNAARHYADLMAGKDPQYVAHPATWLHQGRWQDEELQAHPAAKPDRPNGPPPKPEDIWLDLKEPKH